MVCVNANKANGLSAADLDALSVGLAAAKRVTVYLREPVPSLGLDAGASARVVAVNGSTVTVRPKGIADELPFEANELRKTRLPANPAAPRRQPRKRTDVPSGAVESPEAAVPQVTSTETPDSQGDTADRAPARPRPASPKTATRRNKSSTAPVSVTIASASAGTWEVSISHGTRRQGKPTPVAADRVALAMRELGDDAAIAAVDGVISAARDAAQRRIAELSQELEDARAALANLDGR
ncbi:DUF6319 family protein [Gordonia sp. NPDC003424]